MINFRTVIHPYYLSLCLSQILLLLCIKLLWFRLREIGLGGELVILSHSRTHQYTLVNLAHVHPH